MSSDPFGAYNNYLQQAVLAGTLGQSAGLGVPASQGCSHTQELRRLRSDIDTLAATLSSISVRLSETERRINELLDAFRALRREPVVETKKRPDKPAGYRWAW